MEIFLQRNYPITYQYRKLSLMAAAVLLMLLANMFATQINDLNALILRIILLTLYPAVMFIIIKKVKTAKYF